MNSNVKKLLVDFIFHAKGGDIAGDDNICSFFLVWIDAISENDAFYDFHDISNIFSDHEKNCFYKVAHLLRYQKIFNALFHAFWASDLKMGLVDVDQTEERQTNIKNLFNFIADFTAVVQNEAVEITNTPST